MGSIISAILFVCIGYFGGTYLMAQCDKGWTVTLDTHVFECHRINAVTAKTFGQHRKDD
jgi:hypothetical protein